MSLVTGQPSGSPQLVRGVEELRHGLHALLGRGREGVLDLLVDQLPLGCSQGETALALCDGPRHKLILSAITSAIARRSPRLQSQGTTDTRVILSSPWRTRMVFGTAAVSCSVLPEVE